LLRSTVDQFPITETRYRDRYPKLVWPNVQGGKELRALDDTSPGQKMTAQGHPKDLTFVDRQSTTTVVCESMISAMSYAQLQEDFTSNYLIMNSIEQWEQTLTWLEQGGAWTIILALDNDASGRRTTERLRRQLRTRVTEVRFSVNKDWNDDLPDKIITQSLTSSPYFTIEKVHEALAQARQFTRQDPPGWRWTGHNRRAFCWSRDIMRRHRDFLLDLDTRCPASLTDITDRLTGGRQVFPWAAGYGKTTAVRQLICQEYDRGVLYAVRTQAEADLMAYEIACFLIDRDGGPPSPHDHKVCILHSAARVVDLDLDQEIFS